MKIAHKLILGSTVLVSLLWVVGWYSVSVGRQSLQTAIEQASKQLAVAGINAVDSAVCAHIDNWREYWAGSLAQRFLRESNQRFATLPDARHVIEQQDRDWQAAPEGHVIPFMQALLDNELSGELRRKLAAGRRYKGYDVYREVLVTNVYGVNTAQSGKTSDYRQDDEEWWQHAKRDGLLVEDVGYDKSAGGYSIGICMRVDDPHGETLGVAKVVLNVESILDSLRSEAAKFESREDESSQYTLALFTSDKRLIYDGAGFGELEDRSDILHVHQNSGEERVRVYRRHDPKLGGLLGACAVSRGYDAYSGLGWILVVESAAAEILAPVTALRRDILLISAMVTIGGLALGIGVSVSLSRRVAKLRDAAIEIGKGNLQAGAEDHSNDELGKLSQCLKDMASGLSRRSESLRESEERLQTILDTIQAGVVIIDAETHVIVDVNVAALRMIGARRDEFVGHVCHKFLCPADERECPIAKSEIPQDNTEQILFRQNGQAFAVLKTVTPLNLAGREHLLESFVDISDRKKAEQELRELNAMMLEGLEREKRASARGAAAAKELEQRVREVSEAKQRLEVLVSNTTEREQRMVALKQEVNDLLDELKRAPRYEAPRKVREVTAQARSAESVG